MKGRESGVTEEACWAGFFDAAAAIKKVFGAEAVAGNLVEFGRGSCPCHFALVAKR